MFSQADLAARAGVDPWKLRDKLTAGNPAEIESLAAAFYQAAGNMNDHNSALKTAQGYVAEGYTVNGSSPVDFEAEARGTKQTPEHLNGIAKILVSIAGTLDGKTGTAKSEVTALEGRLNGINGDFDRAVQSATGNMPSDAVEALRQNYLAKAVEQVKTSGNTIKTMVTDYELALIKHMKSLSDLGYVPPAALDEGPNILDLDLSNLDGEKAGGINPDLPLDLATLQKLLDAARASGLDPKRYAALLQQYWLVKAADEAGIDLTKWDPATGVDGNKGNILNVYKLYGKFFLEHPELQWAGMANMIGPSFAGGFMDLDAFKDFAKNLAGKLNSLPPGALGTLPPELQQLAKAGANLSASELQWFETKFLAMQKHIFIDQASMHEAYLNGGTNAINEMHAAGLVDDRTMNAWSDIATGDPQRIKHGNTDLLNREQNQIIAKQYDQMRNHDGPIGAVMTYGMTAVGAASIPGTKTPGEYSPLTVGGDIPVPGSPIPGSLLGGGVHIKTPLPDFNISDRDSRWDYISHDTLPAYQKLLQDHPDQARAIVASSVEDRIADQRLAHRLPGLTKDMLTNWDVDVDAHVGPIRVPFKVPFL